MTPSEQIDQQISSLSDWRGELLARIRQIVNDTDPGLSEEWKWNTGMWVYNKKLICAFGAFKEHVKINFFQGAHLADPKHLFNNGLDAKETRAIDLAEKDTLDENAFRELIKAAIELRK